MARQPKNTRQRVSSRRPDDQLGAMRRLIKTYDDGNQEKPIHTNDRKKASRARQERGHVPTDYTSAAFREGRKRNQLGAPTAKQKICSAITKQSIEAGKPERCRNIAAYGTPKCIHHLTARERAKARDRLYRRNPREVREKAVLQAIKKGEIILPQHTWDQPLWQIASQTHGLLCVGNKELYPMDPMKLAQLTMKSKAIRNHYLTTLSDRSTAFRRARAQHSWFRRNMERLVEAWMSYQHGDMADWIAINSEASQKGWGKPFGEIISLDLPG